VYEQCCICGRFLQPETEFLDQDEAYNIDGNILCEDHVDKFVRDNYRIKLVNEDIPDEQEHIEKL
jgi:hypothetical protein